MPGLIDLYDLHRDHRDRFEILAFHDATAKTFAELEKHLPKVRRQFWHGKDLPFPVLLDATGQTVKAYDINGYPTTLLIDPDGKLVGRASEEDLEKKLPPVPVTERVARALDCGYTIGFRDLPLDKAVNFLAGKSHVDIHFDLPALDAAGIRADTPVPLNASGFISLRGWLDLLTEALGLAYKADDKGLVITTRRAGPATSPSPFQQQCARRIEEALDRKGTLTFRDTPLEEVLEFLESQTDETFVLDPAARRAGQLRPKTPVSGSVRDVPLRQGLRQLLDPLGLTFAVQGEVVVIGPKR